MPSYIPIPTSATKSAPRSAPRSGPRPNPPHRGGGLAAAAGLAAPSSQQRNPDKPGEEPNFAVNQEQWLMFTVRVVNANMEKLRMAKPLSLKDLNNLTPELLRKIMIFLLCYVGDFHETDILIGPKSEKLAPHVELFKDVPMDTPMHQLYHRVKRLFPKEDDTFDYSVLYFPAANPEKTKDALKYLTAYVFFTESINEKFQDTQTECLAEVKEKQKVKAEIETLKGRLNERIVELEERENEVPKLQADQKELLQELEALATRVSELDKMVQINRKDYDKQEAVNIEAQRQLDSLNAKKKTLQEQIVENPEAIVQRSKDAKEWLDRVLKERAEITEKVEQLQEKDNFLEKVIESATQFVSELEEYVPVMQNTADMVERSQKQESDGHLLKIRIEQEKANIEKLEATYEKSKAKIVEIQRQLGEEKKQELEKLEDLRREIENTKKKSAGSVNIIRELKAKEAKCLANLQKNQEAIRKNKEFMEVTLPNKMNELTASIIERMNELMKPLELKIALFNKYRK